VFVVLVAAPFARLRGLWSNRGDEELAEAPLALRRILRLKKLEEPHVGCASVEVHTAAGLDPGFVRRLNDRDALRAEWVPNRHVVAVSNSNEGQPFGTCHLGRAARERGVHAER